MASQTNYDHLKAAYDAEQLHHGDGRASMDIENCLLYTSPSPRD